MTPTAPLAQCPETGLPVLKIQSTNPIVLVSAVRMQGELAGTMEQTGQQKGPSFTREELRRLFSLDTSTSCETAAIMQNSASAQDWQARETSLPCSPDHFT